MELFKRDFFEEGVETERENMCLLIRWLNDNGRLSDIVNAIDDENLRSKLFDEMLKSSE